MSISIKKFGIMIFQLILSLKILFFGYCGDRKD